MTWARSQSCVSSQLAFPAALISPGRARPWQRGKGAAGVGEPSIRDRRADKIEKLAASLWHLGGLWNPGALVRGGVTVPQGRATAARCKAQEDKSLEAAPGERQRGHSRQSQGAGGRGKAQGAQRVGAPKS